jgi:membrane protein implicated in regulation of membrane protease activity
MIDRRVAFFLAAAAVALALAPVAPGEFVDLCIGVSVTYVVLAILSALDRYSRRRWFERRSLERSQQRARRDRA